MGALVSQWLVAGSPDAHSAILQWRIREKREGEREREKKGGREGGERGLGRGRKKGKCEVSLIKRDIGCVRITCAGAVGSRVVTDRTGSTAGAGAGLAVREVLRTLCCPPHISHAVVAMSATACMAHTGAHGVTGAVAAYLGVLRRRTYGAHCKMRTDPMR